MSPAGILSFLFSYSHTYLTILLTFAKSSPKREVRLIKEACFKTLPKAQRTRGLSSSYQRNFLGSYHKVKHKSWSNFVFRISTKHQLLNQASASPINLKFKILTKLSFENSTKIQLNNLYKTSAAKCWTNSSSQINKLLPTWSSVSTSARVTISTSFELPSSHARVTSIKFTKRELGS